MSSVYYHFKPYKAESGTEYTIVRIVNVRVEAEVFNEALDTIKTAALAKGKDGWLVISDRADKVKKIGEKLFKKLPEEQQTEVRDYLEMVAA